MIKRFAFAVACFVCLWMVSGWEEARKDTGDFWGFVLNGDWTTS